MQKLIVIPARGGSKGIPGKNIYPVDGKPLLGYTLEFIQKANISDADVVVSTDSDEIKKVARQYEGITIIDRPENISGDTASTEAALLHALDYMGEMKNKEYDYVITLQATSPLREIDTLKKIIDEYERKYPEYDALLSLNENRSDFWHKTSIDSFEPLFKNASRRRQEREPLYVENSAYYITDVKALRATGSVLGTSVNGYLISDIEAVDINEMIDIYIVEGIIKAMHNC